jgi:hypothetical protein
MTSQRPRLSIAILAAVLLVPCAVAIGCGSSSGNTSLHDAGPADATKQDVMTMREAAPDTAADTGRDAPFDAGKDVAATYPAKHPPMPAVDDFGGPVFTVPNLIPIFFADDSEQATITSMLTGLGASSYWSGTTSQYCDPSTLDGGCVTGVMVGTAIVTTDTAPTTIDDTAIQTWLQTNLNGSDPTWGSPAPGNIYLVYYPSTTTVTLSGTQSCTQFGGYHNETTDSMGNPLAYAVFPRCTATFPPIPSVTPALTPEQYLTFVTSRDIVEATTDPEIVTDPAYASPDMTNLAWTLLTGGEVGGMCAYVPNIDLTPSSFPYTVQRTWSNASAAASHDPCVPIPTGEVYFNSAPVMTDTIILGSGSTVGVEVPIGMSKTIPLDLYSDGPTSGPWTIKAIDVASVYNGEKSALSFSFDKTSGQNGDVVNMTITALASDPVYGGELFVLVSTLGSEQSIWIGAVGN